MYPWPTACFKVWGVSSPTSHPNSASPPSSTPNSLIPLPSTSLPTSSPPIPSTSLSPTFLTPSTSLSPTFPTPSTSLSPTFPTPSTSLSPTFPTPSTPLPRSTSVPISTLFTPGTTSTLSTSLPSSFTCCSLSVTQQLSSSEPCLTTNPCLANSLPPNPSPVHSLPPNPCLANSLHPNPSPAHSLPPNPSPVHSLPPNPCLANSLHPNPSPAHSLPPNPCLAHSLPPNPCPNATEPIPTAINKKVSWLGGDSATKDPKPGPSASPKVKRKRGRPAKSAVRKDRGKKIPLIHDFIRGLLEDPTMKDVVFWEDKTEGMFRINDSNGIANEWGKLKNKKGMTYEKFSRALRYHHRSKSSALIPVPGRLLFKFTSITKSRTSG